MAGTLSRSGAAVGACVMTLAAVLTACGNSGSGSVGTGTTSSASPSPSSSPSSSPSASGKPMGTTVTVQMTEYKLTLSSKTFKSGDYTFVAENKGHIAHSLEVEGQGGDVRLPHDLAPGQSAQLRVTLKNGSYELYCPVDGHKDLGMKTDITVGGATGGS
ncbi:copper-binding protein [Streptomyces sp. NPDC001843]|uniref:copper-binding protein n=1 Tax=Streptomyces sp. NPDC001843 TaxID=3364617 RepID=UPI0036806B24